MCDLKQAPAYTRVDFHQGPFVVFYEVTQACDLVCQHCRACAQPLRHPEELDTETACELLGQLAQFPKSPLVVLTGGDPLKRSDVFDLVRRGVGTGLEMAMTPSATPLVTRTVLQRLHDEGLSRLAVSLDGVDAATHDAFRGVSGSFDRTWQILQQGRDVGLSLQVNTTVTAVNLEQIDAIAESLASCDIALWSVFFLVPVGRGEQIDRISAEQYEVVFDRLWHHAQTKPYGIKTTEAPHYRRFVLQRRGSPQGNTRSSDGVAHQRAPLGVNDGKGAMFIDHTGRIFPSGFLPIECGQFPSDSLVDVYRDSSVFRSLRDANLLRGKCGECEFRQICGGSRARSYALTGDALAAEPDCVYQPRQERLVQSMDENQDQYEKQA